LDEAAGFPEGGALGVLDEGGRTPPLRITEELVADSTGGAALAEAGGGGVISGGFGGSAGSAVVAGSGFAVADTSAEGIVETSVRSAGFGSGLGCSRRSANAIAIAPRARIPKIAAVSATIRARPLNGGREGLTIRISGSGGPDAKLAAARALLGAE
jgi:hypothetical protein